MLLNKLTSLEIYLFLQIKRPIISRYVRVFQADDMQVLSVDVANSTDAVYSGNTLSISSTTQFLSNRMYYLVADSGVCACVRVCVHVCVCVCVCLNVCVCLCVCERERDREREREREKRVP